MGELCGQYGYTCLDTDPCPSEEGDEGQSSDNDSLYITVAAIAFIACLCIACVVFLIILHVRAKRGAKTAANIYAQPLPPPPAYSTITRTQSWAPTRTTNNRAGRHPIFAIPLARKAPVTGTAGRPQPNAPTEPSRSEAPDITTHGVSSSVPRQQRIERSSIFRSAPTLGVSALEGSTKNVEVGHRPCPDTDDAERIWLAIKESRRVQTISEAIVRQETSPSQPGAYAVITGTGVSSSNIADGGNAEEEVPMSAEEKVPMSADEKDNSQYTSSGSEWGSDGEAKTKEEESRA